VLGRWIGVCSCAGGSSARGGLRFDGCALCRLRVLGRAMGGELQLGAGERSEKAAGEACEA
jgi:hypothetical protein